MFICYTDFNSVGRVVDCSSKNTINYSYQQVAGSIPASRKIITYNYFLYVIY